MSERDSFLLGAVIVFVGAGVLAFHCIRDGLIRRRVKIGALRDPVTGSSAVVLSLVWLVIALGELGIGFWLLSKALSIGPKT